MRTRMLLCLSALLNVTLLGAVVYVYKQIPEKSYVQPDARVVSHTSAPEEVSLVSPNDSGLRFRPVVVALLPSAESGERPQLFDIETGLRLTEPDYEFFGYNAKANIAWIRTNGLDISGVVNPEGQALCVCYYMAVVPVHPDRWERGTATEVLTDPELAAIHDPKRPVIMPAHHQTDTFLFRTSDGATGILQVPGVTPDRSQVRLRYKLVEPSPVVAAGSSRTQL